jgi:UrcA family protein
MKQVMTLLLLPALALCGTRAVCSADRAYTPPHLAVNYSGADLSTTEGVKALYARLHAAAQRVCGDLDGANISLRYACVHDAMSNAIQSIDKPLLSAYYRERNGGLEPAVVANAK